MEKVGVVGLRSLLAINTYKHLVKINHINEDLTKYYNKRNGLIQQYSFL